jgi:hypothetical protein
VSAFLRSLSSVPSRSASLALRVIATVALCATFLLLMPLYPAQVSDGLDSSWAYAVNEALAQHLVFGHDLIFTSAHAIFNNEGATETAAVSSQKPSSKNWGNQFIGK